jgi:hypothetical protein
MVIVWVLEPFKLARAVVAGAQLARRHAQKRMQLEILWPSNDVTARGAL